MELQFQFHDEKLIYYKNYITEELDSKYGDLQSKILDCENSIFRQISKQVLSFEFELLKVNKFISFLDIFTHFYIFSDKYQLYKPLLSSEENIFKFQDGRNVINEIIIGAKYIPTIFNSNNKNIHIIFGPMSTGKTIFLKLIGSLVYLSQIGSYIPAVGYKSNIFSVLLSNININENNIDQLSGFTTEAKELKVIIDIFEKNIDKGEVLILLDEPYKRTSEKNQNCLIAGTLEYIYDLLDNNPNSKSQIFITLSPEIVYFLNEKEIIREKYTNIFQMETIELQKVNNTYSVEKEYVNTYKLKNIPINEIPNNDNMNSMGFDQLLLVKELGLDNALFLRALEIDNLFKKNEKIWPNIEKFTYYANIINHKKNDIYNKIIQYTRSQISLEENKQEYDIINYLNELFK